MKKLLCAAAFLALLTGLRPLSAQQTAADGPLAAPQAGAPAGEVKYPSLEIQGFADIDFSAQNQRLQRVGTATGFTPPGQSSDFDLGQFVLHFAGQLAPRVSYFAEVSWTAGPNGYSTTIERSVLRYAFNDYFKISAGRYHTPIVYWNTAYHHGLWLQTTINRPEMIQFGGRLIPVHFVGLQAQGLVPQSGSLNLQYDVGIGNGRGANIAEPGDAGDINNNRAWMATLTAQPDWAYKWEFGGSVYHDSIGQASGLPTTFGEWIRTIRLVDTGETPEIIAEAADIRHDELGGAGSSWSSQAWYVQVAYRLPWFQAQWKPYYRFEYIHIPKTDPVFNPATNPVPSLAGSIAGVRYDFCSYAAFKMEYRNSRRNPGEPRIQGAFAQIALTF
ncbi:MAG TPA: hypothetical protein VIE13_07340 [Terriglobales bacterium]|jgi:hypothetical protein